MRLFFGLLAILTVANASPLPCSTGSLAALAAAGPCSLGNALFTFDGNTFSGISVNNQLGSPDIGSLLLTMDTSDPMRPGFFVSAPRGGFGAVPTDEKGRIDSLQSFQNVRFYYSVLPNANLSVVAMETAIVGGNAAGTGGGNIHSFYCRTSVETNDPDLCQLGLAVYPPGFYQSNNFLPLPGPFQGGSVLTKFEAGSQTLADSVGAYVTFQGADVHFDLVQAPEPASFVPLVLSVAGFLLFARRTGGLPSTRSLSRRTTQQK